MMIKRKMILFLCLIFSCKKYENIKNTTELRTKIPTLLLGSFHFKKTSDANSIDYKYNDEEVNQITKVISKFEPTIICIEFEPEYDDVVKENFQHYLKTNKFDFEKSSEAEVFSYKIGQLSNTKQIRCIDNKLGYDYGKIEKIAKKYNEKNYLKFKKEFLLLSNRISESKNLKEKLLLLNSEKYKFFIKNSNADILTYINSDNGFEGADIASEFYRRNIRIFANLNKVKVNDDDRILIIFGAGHIPFLEDLIRDSPKYQLEKLDNYLKQNK